MDVDGAEIKVNVATDDIERAVDELELDDDSALRVWFYEDTTPGAGVPLLDAGIVIRVRVNGDGTGDSTVKLRPCRQSQFTPHWVAVADAEDSPLKVEQDWSGVRRVLAVSFKADLDATAVSAVTDGDGNGIPAGVLGDDQVRFLDECGAVRVNLSQLVPLGPISATKWDDADADAVKDLKAEAERWTVGDLDFLEVSLKVKDLAKAERAQRDLVTALGELGIGIDTSEDSKTRRVLTALAT